MTLSLYPAFFIFALIMVTTPGPANLLLMSSGAQHGLFKSLPFVAGVTFGKLFLTIQFQSIELAGDIFDEQGDISLFSPGPISLEDYYYDIDNSWSKFNSWAQWDSYYSRNYIRLEYAGFSIPSLNYPPR